LYPILCRVPTSCCSLSCRCFFCRHNSICCKVQVSHQWTDAEPLHCSDAALGTRHLKMPDYMHPRSLGNCWCWQVREIACHILNVYLHNYDMIDASSR
jgi:hypothetical protein